MNIDPQIAARMALDRYCDLSAGLRQGEASLLDQAVRLISGDPLDWLLALLLDCAGARTWYEGPSPGPNTFAPQLRALLDHLIAVRPELDAMPLLHGLDVGQLPKRESSDKQDILVVRGAMPADADRAVQALADWAACVRCGGDLEILGTDLAPLTAAAIDSIRKSAPALQLGIRACAGNRLALVHLDQPLREYPVEGRDHPAILAHCLARLEYAADHAAGAQVLEAGSATGIGGRLFLERGARRVVCLDRSTEALALGRTANPDERLHYCQGDLNQPLPFADASFDLVVCLEVLEHIEKPCQAIAEFHRVLRPGGRLIASVPDQRFEMQWTKINRFDNPFHLRSIPPAEFRSWLQAFARISLAWQRDFVGSAVVDEGEDHPTGQFETQGQLNPTAMVQLAVCVKAPVEAARPVVRRARMHLHDNYSERQLALHQQIKHLQETLVRQRCAMQQAVHRSRAQAFRRLLDGTHELFLTGGVLVATECCDPRQWGELTRILLNKRQLRFRPRPIEPGSPCYSLPAGSLLPQLILMLPHSRPIQSVLFPASRQGVSWPTLWHWHRRYVKEFWFLEANGWQRVDATSAWCRRVSRALKSLARAAAAWGRMPGLQLAWQRRRAALPRQPVEWVSSPVLPLPTGRLRIVQYIGALTPGGAERQLANLAEGLRQRGHAVRVLTTHPLDDACGHYVPRLQAAGIPVRRAGSTLSLAGCRRQPGDWLPADLEEIRPHVNALAAELLHDRPDVLHAWLDEASIIGVLAGLIADVPRLVIGLRVPNPSHYPRFHQPHMLPWYQMLQRSPRVAFVANSAHAADSYAGWIGMPAERIHVVPNGLCGADFPPPTPARRKAARLAFGLSPDQVVVAGVFRCYEEKRPHLFLDLVEAARAMQPNLAVLHAGSGPLEEELHRTVATRQLGSFVRLLGRQTDIAEVLLAADVLLHPAALESLPNAVMEAQRMGVPVVATRAGATAEAIIEGKTGLLADVDDADQLLVHLARLLADAELREKMGRAASEFAATAFALDRMIDGTLAAYRHGGGPRIHFALSQPQRKSSSAGGFERTLAHT